MDHRLCHTADGPLQYGSILHSPTVVGLVVAIVPTCGLEEWLQYGEIRVSGERKKEAKYISLSAWEPALCRRWQTWHFATGLPKSLPASFERLQNTLSQLLRTESWDAVISRVLAATHSLAC